MLASPGTRPSPARHRRLPSLGIEEQLSGLSSGEVPTAALMLPQTSSKPLDAINSLTQYSPRQGEDLSLSGSDEDLHQEASLLDTARPSAGDIDMLSATVTSLIDTARKDSGAGMQTAGSAVFDVDAALASPMAALRQAEALERSLTAGAGSDASGMGGIASGASIRQYLRKALAQWPSEGGVDSRGAPVGGQVILRVDHTKLLEEAFRDTPALGSPSCVAAFHAVVAVGTSAGVVLVLLPRGITSGGQLSGQPQLMRLGQLPGSNLSATQSLSHCVTTLAFSAQGSMLLAGHAGGEVVFWELRRTSWENVKSIRDAHASPVTAAAFLDGGASALTGDAQGRVLLHPVASYLSLTAKFTSRLTRGAQAVLVSDGASGGASQQQQQLDPGRAAFIQEGAGRMEGLILAGGARGLHVCRVGSDGRIATLHTLNPPPAPAGSVLPPQQPPGGACTQLAGWEEEGAGATVGLVWLEGPALAVMSQQGRQQGTLVRLIDPGGAEHERLQLDLSLLPPPHLAMGSQGSAPVTVPLHSACTASTDRLLCLTTQGMVTARMLGWQERMAVLRGLSMWEAALSLGLSIFAAAQGSAEETIPTNSDGGSQNGASAVPRGGPKAAWRCEGSGAATEGVIGRLVQSLMSLLDGGLGSDQDDEEQALRAAGTAIHVALTLGQEEVLWQEVFPRFVRGGRVGPFMQALIPCILSGTLTSLAPEVVQALVEHCVSTGQVDTVERCVLRLNIASLDINQVARLSRQHALYSALTFIYTHALDDFVAPIAEFVAAISSVQQLDDSDAAAKDTGSSTHLGFKLLAYLRCCLQGNAFPPGSGELVPSKASVQTAPSLEASLPGPHAVLRCLLSISAGAVLVLLREALHGWDALEVELREAARLPGADTAGVSSAAQCCCDALVTLLNAQVLGNEDAESRALRFLMHLVVDGRAVVPLHTGSAMLQLLAHTPSLEQQQQQQQHLQDAEDDSQPEDPEAMMIAVMKSLHSQGLTAGLAARHQALAQGAGFTRAEAEVLHSQGLYSQALQRHLQHDSSGTAALLYITRVLDDEGLAAADGRRRLREAVLDNLSQLAQADAEGTAALVRERFPQDQVPFIRRLEGCGRVQFQLLQAFMASQTSAQAGSSTTVSADSALNQAVVGELYIQLACQYSPGASTLGSQAMSLFGGVPHRTLSHSASTLLATSEAVSAGEALVAALGLCQRHCASGVASPATSEALWFRLLQTFVELLFETRHPEQTLGAADVRSAALNAGQEVSQEVVAGFMEVVIAAMARCLPLKDIGERMLALYHAHEYGDFKGTIQGLLAAYNYELSILQSANRLVAADAFHSLHALYRRRTRCLPASAHAF
ncbi:hypothetical protein WJX73_001767 [Symbiochloris irregularis]|uniref:Vacuolar protein sorting-associated protein 8 central domain-containing protein n=1 Tax=Symbiochloris irregularis TaxID=706552 RepID=A0AAW1NP04_9CHLO